MKLNTLVKFLNKELKIKSIEDSSRNGLQVRGRNEVKKIGIAVDSGLEIFKKAKKLGCDAVLVHHGILWKKKNRHILTREKRIGYLKRNKMSLLGYHLPLDMNKKYGNNSLIMDLIGAKEKKKFASFGFKGKFKQVTSMKKIVKDINKKMKTKCVCLQFGKTKIKTVGVISGSYKEGLGEAIKQKLDLYLTGEIQNQHHLARDNKINVIFAGHYATETFGVKAVGKLLEKKFRIKTVFINHPTGI